MTYSERFKDMLIITAKGFGIGLVLSIILNIWVGNDGIIQLIGSTIITAIFLGAFASVIICIKNDNGVSRFMGEALSRIATGTLQFAIGGFNGFSPALLVVGIIRFMLGLVVLIPVAVYVVMAYIVNFIYYGIMALLEKKSILKEKEELCEIIDKVVAIATGIVSIIIGIIVLKRMM